MTDKMYNIGEVVTFIRYSTADGIQEGEGKLAGYGLNPDGRIVALVKTSAPNEEGEDVPTSFNIHAKAVNPMPGFRDRFRGLMEEITAFEKEANEAIVKLTDEANAKIEGMNTAVLGEPMKL